MLMSFPDLYQGREEVRMMYRATHIYILMASLMNLAIAMVLIHRKQIDWLWARRAASALVLLTPGLFLAGFFLESPEFNLERPFTFWGVVLLFAGTAIYVLLDVKLIIKNILSAG